MNDWRIWKHAKGFMWRGVLGAMHGGATLTIPGAVAGFIGGGVANTWGQWNSDMDFPFSPGIPANNTIGDVVNATANASDITA
jgi:hypothetical protein